jgi:competence protein ComEC
LFVICVLAFIAGIYIEAFYDLALKPAIVGLVASVLLIPFLRAKKRSLGLCLLLVAFMLTGVVRLALLTDLPPVMVDESESLYAGTVVETSQRSKVIALTNPESLNNLRVAFHTSTNLETGDRVYLRGRLLEFTPASAESPRKVWRWLKRLEGVNHEIKGKIVLIRSGTNSINALRNFFRKRIEESGARHTDVQKALTIGDRASLDEEINRLFLRTGTSHILAISGFNVGIISGFFFFIARTLLRRFRRFRLSGRDVKYAAAFTIPFPFIFMLIAGSGVSVIRATIMVGIYMLALIFERGRHVLNTMALSALIILLIYPHSLFTPSFQLTFMSLLAIVVCVEKLYPTIKKVKLKPAGWTLSVMLTTAAATLGTAPIVIFHFYGINLFSIIHNLVTVPLTGVLATSLSLVGMSVPFGNFLLVLSGWIVHLNLILLNFLDWGYLFPVVRPDLYEILLYYALFFSLLQTGRKPVVALLIAVLLPLCLLQTYLVYEKRFHNDLCLNFIDVGMGEATLIEAPRGVRILIDGGGSVSGDFDTGSRIVMPFLLSRKILTLDYVINSHSHADHMGGLVSILRHFKVNAFVSTAFLAEYPEHPSLLQMMRGKETAVQFWKKGDTCRLPGETSIQVLYPPQIASLENLNDTSLVIKIIQRNRAFLFPGDISEGVEEELLESGAPLRADVLKIPHHGSRTSSSLAFLGAVRPELAILSGGGMMQNLPALETLERYRGLSIPVLRTDRQGPITVCSHGGRLTYRVSQR